MIYLDNSATTYKKPFSVKYQTKKYIQSANPGRSGHNLSVKSATMITNTRLLLQDMYNAPATENVIFTSNCTEALNIAILGTVKKFGENTINIIKYDPIKLTEVRGISLKSNLLSCIYLYKLLATIILSLSLYL